MVVRVFTCLVLTLSISAVAQDAAPAKKEAPKLESNRDKASYAVGFNIGQQLKNQALTKLEVSKIAAGIAAALKNEENALTREQIEAAFAAWNAERDAANLEAGNKFLEANKTQEGVKVTKSGLQYIVLKEGTGESPTATSIVSTHYRGRHVDGTQFDSSYAGESPVAGEEPISFAANGVISGWTEALIMMKVGAKYRLFIPGELAYGIRGKDAIEPNCALIFDIELVAVTNGELQK